MLSGGVCPCSSDGPWHTLSILDSNVLIFLGRQSSGLSEALLLLAMHDSNCTRRLHFAFIKKLASQFLTHRYLLVTAGPLLGLKHLGHSFRDVGGHSFAEEDSFPAAALPPAALSAHH